MTSIRRRLLAILLASFVVAWVLLAVSTYFNARHEIEELFDSQLAESARVLLALAVHEVADDNPDDLSRRIVGQKYRHPYEEKIAFQIWRRDRLLLRSPNAPDTHLSAHLGLSRRTIADEPWHVFALTDASGAMRVEAGEHDEVRQELVRKILAQTLLPFALTLPLLVLLLWQGVSRGLRPLARLTTEIAARSPEKLAPVVANGVPLEIRPLTTALNDLLARLEGALDAERRFTANAAHELRTPLAALKTQAQVALRAADNERAQALQQIVRGVDRATRLVEQLLTLARVDPDAAAAAYESVDLAALATAVVAELAPAAVARHLDIAVREDSRGHVRGDAASLAILARNLIDNAIRYTPKGGRVEVAVVEAGASAVLTVCDTGPGIAEAERAQVSERFYRVPGSPGNGSGLGLSIVRRIAALHGAEIALVTPAEQRGLCVRVTFARV